MAKPKPTPGHKFAGYNYGVSTRCECGWTSVVFFGQGARSQAAGEWRRHIEREHHESAGASS